MTNIFEKHESNVRGYCRVFNKVFNRAEGEFLYDEDGNAYIDFFAGAGTLNYGHNPADMRQALVDYLFEGGVVHSLDMYTAAKRRFIERFQEVILAPRNMDYKIMFTGPTGTNAVEAALKLARKVTGRSQVISFTNGFHGMTLGSLAVTGNAGKRKGAGVPLDNVTRMPFEGYAGTENTLALIEHYLSDGSSGVEKPAAFILETVQGEGGVNVASKEWLQGLSELAKRHDILLIADDIQVGCGRTGSFFSFDEAGIQPDIITLSKSLSGFGLPFAITIFKSKLDVWEPGEHNGTFRGHNLAFVTATKALDYWADDAFKNEVLEKGEFVKKALQAIRLKFPEAGAEIRGRGLIWGIEFSDVSLANKISALAFKKGLLIETAGGDDQVLKFLPPLMIHRDNLKAGLGIVLECLEEILCKEKDTVEV